MEKIVDLIENNLKVSYRKKQKNSYYFTIENNEFSNITVLNNNIIEIESLKKSDSLDKIFKQSGIILVNESYDLMKGYDAVYNYEMFGLKREKEVEPVIIETHTHSEHSLEELTTNISKFGNSISDLNISLEDLYEEKQQLRVEVENKKHKFHVILKDGHLPDCKINSPVPRLVGRTNKGIKKFKFNSLSEIENDITQWINKGLNELCVLRFSLSNDIKKY